MEKNQVKKYVMRGNLVQCSQDEYQDVRRYLLEFSGESIDNGQTVYAVISLGEVKRLDSLFHLTQENK